MDIVKVFQEWRTRNEQKVESKGLFRDETREDGALGRAVGAEVLRNGKAWPIVLEDFKTKTTTVPQTYEGLLAFLCSFDGLLLDEELIGMRALVSRMVPMKAEWQPALRAARKQEDEAMRHMREEHPDEYDRVQGWRV